jgi:hypothetical protein
LPPALPHGQIRASAGADELPDLATERRWSRTIQRLGCSRLPVLKTAGQRAQAPRLKPNPSSQAHRATTCATVARLSGRSFRMRPLCALCLLLASLCLVPTAAALPANAPVAEASRPCVTAGRVIRNRENVTCERAKRTARYFFAHVEGPRGWTCERSGPSLWAGYCESRRSYFQWSRIR